MNDKHSLLTGIDRLQALQDRDLGLGDVEVDRLLVFLELLRHWNRRIRLVGSATNERAVDEILVDSLAVLLALEPDMRRLVDVGSGAGLPGIPLAIARPELHVVTLEPRRKKHSFQRAARRELGLDNLEPIAARLEEYEFEEVFDAAVSRATWPLAEWFGRGRRLVAGGGTLIGVATNVADVPEEAKALRYCLSDRERLLVSSVRGGAA